MILVAGLAVLLGAAPRTAAASQSVDVYPGQDLAAIVNTDLDTTATKFYLHDRNGHPYTYDVAATLRLGDGDALIGDKGTFVRRGLARDPEPTVGIAAIAGVSNVVKVEGRVHLEWLKLIGGTGRYRGGSPQAGTGSGLAMGQASNASSVYAVQVTGSDATGISNAHGTFDSLELNRTTRDPNFLGFTGAGLKAVTEVEVRNSYVHDNQGNGLWCDENCKDARLRQNGFWVRDNLVVDNGRAGIRYEKVGDLPTAGEALIEGNKVRGANDGTRGGVDIRDAQDALVRNNVFGASPVVGNTHRVAVRASDSGRTDRPDLGNITISGNVLNGEMVQGCSEPDDVVVCKDIAPGRIAETGSDRRGEHRLHGLWRFIFSNWLSALM